MVETLEDRALLTAYSVATAADLIADINAANKQGGANTITLAAPTTSPYVLTAVNNATDGANGLPVIGGNKTDALTIAGNGDTIERSTASGTPDFRLFDIASGGSLTLDDVTVQNGLAFGSSAGADGGAIYNQGTLTLNGVTVQNNEARGVNGSTFATKLSAATGGDAAGGGIWSNGTVNLQDLTLPGGPLLHTVLQYNEALGGAGGDVYVTEGAPGGQALGGALYLAGGKTGVSSVTMTNASFLNNLTEGGTGGNDGLGQAIGGTGGAAFGGAVDIAEAGTVIMNGNTLENNEAAGGVGGYSVKEALSSQGTGGAASGGAVYVTGGKTAATVGMESMVFQYNIAQGGAGGTYPYYTDFWDVQGLGGNAYGGALFAAGGQATIQSTTVQDNEALGGQGGSLPGVAPGEGYGGGIEIASAAALSLDSFTVDNTTNNQIFTSFQVWAVSNIDGTYILLT